MRQAEWNNITWGTTGRQMVHLKSFKLSQKLKTEEKENENGGNKTVVKSLEPEQLTVSYSAGFAVGIDPRGEFEMLKKCAGMQDIFILGGSDTGVVNAAYKFLEIYFNYDYYYRNCIEIDKNVTDCKFKTLDVLDIPDVNSYYGNHYVYEYDKSVHPLDAEGLGFDTVEDEIKAKNLRAGQFTHVGYLLLPIHKQQTIPCHCGNGRG